MTAIITGYSSGLGQALTEILLDRGWTVVGVSRRPLPDGLFGRARDRIRSVQGSVADQATVDRAFATADGLGGLRLLINCAGQGCFGEAGSYSASDVTAAIEGNLAGLIIFSDRAVRSMRNGKGDIVNIMSTAAKKFRPAETVYTAAKWGAKAYTRTLREAIKSQKLNIRIFEVYPCGMNTAFWRDAIRPVADGKAFPEPAPIAQAILAAVLANQSSYQQELTFERS